MSIRQELVKGLFWSAIEKYSSLIVSVIISMILARLLSPELYGEVAIASIALGFLSTISSMGIGPAIIQNQKLTKEDLNIIYTFSFFLSLILVAFFFCSSWYVAKIYDDDNLIIICHILCINLFFATINMVPHALMAKNKRFKDIAKRTLFFQTTSGAISVLAAYNGCGIYALLISPVITSVGTFFFNLYCYPLKLTFNLSFSPIRKILSFSIYEFAFELFNYFSVNLDKLIIGKYISNASLGYYEKSYRLMQMPLGLLTSVINPVLQPVLATLQDDSKSMAVKYNKIIRFVSTFSVPIAALFVSCDYEIINFFYGGKWNAAVASFGILSISLPTHVILAMSGSIWQACNATKYMFWTGVVNTMITIFGFIVAALIWNTIEALAWAWTTTAIINFFNTHINMYLFVLKSSILKMLSYFVSPLLNGFIIYVFLLSMEMYVPMDSVIIALLTKSLIAIIITLLYIQFTGRYNIIDYIKVRLNT